MRPHPLQVWLNNFSIPAYKFAKTNKISFGILYKYFRGVVHQPSVEILQRIEKGTNKAVTVQMQADWFKTVKK